MKSGYIILIQKSRGKRRSLLFFLVRLLKVDKHFRTSKNEKVEKETGMEGVEYNRNKIIEHNKIEQKHISEQQYKI